MASSIRFLRSASTSNSCARAISMAVVRPDDSAPTWARGRRGMESLPRGFGLAATATVTCSLLGAGLDMADGAFHLRIVRGGSVAHDQRDHQRQHGADQQPPHSVSFSPHPHRDETQGDPRHRVCLVDLGPCRTSRPGRYGARSFSANIATAWMNTPGCLARSVPEPCTISRLCEVRRAMHRSVGRSGSDIWSELLRLGYVLGEAGFVRQRRQIIWYLARRDLHPALRVEHSTGSDFPIDGRK